MFGLEDGGFKPDQGRRIFVRGDWLRFASSGARVKLMLQGPTSRCPEIRFVRLIRLKCGGSLREAEKTEAREGGERTEQEVSHQSDK